MSETKVETECPRRRYTDQFEFASMGFFTLDRNGRIIKANSSGVKLLGVELDNLLKQPFSKFVADDFQERFDAHCKQVLENQSRESCDLKLGNNDQPLYIQIESTALKNKTGNDSHIQSSVTNITDRKRAEEALCDALEKSRQRAKEVASLLESLEHSEQRFRSVVESAIDAIITIDHRGKIIFWNQRAELMFGHASDEVIGKPATIIMPERFRKAHIERINQVASHGKSNITGKTIELAGLKKNRTEFPLELSLARWETNEGPFFTAIIRDITARKQAEEALKRARTELERRVQERTAELAEANKELRRRVTECELAEAALRESEQKYSTLVEDALIGVYIIQDGKIVFANDKFAEIYGYSKNKLIGMESLQLVHPEDRHRVRQMREKRLRGEKVPYEYEIRGLKKNGETIWVTRSYSLINYDGKPAISGIVADMTKRRLVEDALRRSDKELRILSNQLLSAEEKERKRIASELHDGIGQALSAIKFSVENVLREIDDHRGTFDSSSLKSVIPLTQKTIEEVRGIVKDLRPSILDDLGILATITWFCREFQNVYSNIRITKKIEITENDIPPPLKTIIYRLLQEALNNVSKHSQADQVYLSLHKQPDDIELLIKDNGRGFDLEKTISRVPSQRGFGLASMRERAELSGGRFDIQSKIGKGTTINVSWKL
ncbi:MAG: PAS domain S-box protein [Desulfobacterales bacterium]